MNKDRILELADRIERFDTDNKRPGLGFDMRNVITTRYAPTVKFEDAPSPLPGNLPDDWCGAVGCIAGWALVLWGTWPTPGNQMSTASEILGLEREQARRLFDPAYYRSVSMRELTREDAVATLRRLAETGDVVWPFE